LASPRRSGWSGGGIARYAGPSPPLKNRHPLVVAGGKAPAGAFVSRGSERTPYSVLLLEGQGRRYCNVLDGREAPRNLGHAGLRLACVVEPLSEVFVERIDRRALGLLGIGEDSLVWRQPPRLARSIESHRSGPDQIAIPPDQIVVNRIHFDRPETPVACLVSKVVGPIGGADEDAASLVCDLRSRVGGAEPF